MQRAFAEAPSITDAIAVSILKTANFADASAITDNQNMQFGKTTSDNVSSNDLQTLSYFKNISETTVATDDVNGAAAGDDQTMAFFKSSSNTANVTDSVVNSPNKILSDASATSDSGSYIGQGYCDFTYFNADYVGYTGTF